MVHTKEIMKIKRYFPRFYFVFLFVITVVYCGFSYVLIKNGIYLGPLLLVIIFTCYINCINLYEDRVTIIEFYKIKKVEFDMIERIEIAEYSYKTFNITTYGNFSVVYIYLKNNKRKKFFYFLYSKKAVTEIINCALKKNVMIELDSKVKKLIGYVEDEKIMI